MFETFFSFRGRLNRKPYWLRTLALVAMMYIALLAAYVIATGFLFTNVIAILLFILAFVFFIGSLSVVTRRLHDRDKSGWWMLLFIVLPSALQVIGEQAGEAGILLLLASFAIGIWALVELGFLRGNVGPNRFGPDPLEAGRAD